VLKIGIASDADARARLRFLAGPSSLSELREALPDHRCVRHVCAGSFAHELAN
jgi:hypothetical protein